MTKQEFVEKVADRAQLSKRDADKAVNAFLDAITEALRGGQEVAFTGFGKFSTSNRAARQGVNPRTGERVQIALVNHLDKPTIAHWHGLAVDTHNDGAGMNLVAPGESYAYDFAATDRGALYWYHPHPHGETARQMYNGLYGAITVQPGDRIPGIPSDSAKLRGAYEPSDLISVGINVVYASSQYALGDDNNADIHGRLPAYTVVHLDARYQATRELQLFMLVNNLFDRRYQSLALLGANAFTGPGGSFGPANGVDPVAGQFRAPGAPRGVWVGLRYAFDSRHADAR